MTIKSEKPLSTVILVLDGFFLSCRGKMTKQHHFCAYFSDILKILQCENNSRLIYERKRRFKVW